MHLLDNIVDVIVPFKTRGYDGPLKLKAIHSLYCLVHNGKGIQYILVFVEVSNHLLRTIELVRRPLLYKLFHHNQRSDPLQWCHLQI